MSDMFYSSLDTWYTLLFLKGLWNKIPCSKGDRVRPTQKCPQSYGKKHRCVFSMLSAYVHAWQKYMVHLYRQAGYRRIPLWISKRSFSSVHSICFHMEYWLSLIYLALNY